MMLAFGSGAVSMSMVSSTAVFPRFAKRPVSILCAPPEASDRRIPALPYTCRAAAPAHWAFSSTTHERGPAMQVQVNTGDGLTAKDTLERWASDFLNGELARFRDEISRVEVQLTDEAKGRKSGDDMRCMLE